MDGPRPRAGRIGRTAGERLVLPRIDQADDAAPTPDGAAAEASAPRFTQEELDAALAAARDEAYREAETKTRAALAAETQQREATALEAIARALGQSQAAYDAWIAGCAQQSRDLGLALARAIVPRALARAPLADIEAMLTELVPRLHGQPELELRLAPDLVEAGRAALANAARSADYRGAIEVVADADLADGDARLGWHRGAAERSLARLEAEAAAVIEACLPAEDEDLPSAPAIQVQGPADAGARREERSDE